MQICISAWNKNPFIEAIGILSGSGALLEGLRKQFSSDHVRIGVDCVLISAQMIAELEVRRLHYILPRA